MLTPNIDIFSGENITVQEGVVKYYNHIYQRLLALTRNREWAEDLAQTTVVKALTHQEQFKPGTNFHAWIFKIAFNAFVNDLRRIQMLRDIISRRAFLEMYGEYTAQRTETPEETAMGQTSQIVREAIDKMPEDFRKVLLLTAAGASYNAVAAQEKIPFGTVMSRRHRVVERLRQLLADYALENYGITGNGDPRGRKSRKESGPNLETELAQETHGRIQIPPESGDQR